MELRAAVVRLRANADRNSEYLLMVAHSEAKSPSLDMLTTDTWFCWHDNEWQCVVSTAGLDTSFQPVTGTVRIDTGAHVAARLTVSSSDGLCYEGLVQTNEGDVLETWDASDNPTTEVCTADDDHYQIGATVFIACPFTPDDGDQEQRLRHIPYQQRPTDYIYFVTDCFGLAPTFV